MLASARSQAASLPRTGRTADRFGPGSDGAPDVALMRTVRRSRARLSRIDSALAALAGAAPPGAASSAAGGLPSPPRAGAGSSWNPRSPGGGSVSGRSVVSAGGLGLGIGAVGGGGEGAGAHGGTSGGACAGVRALRLGTVRETAGDSGAFPRAQEPQQPGSASALRGALSARSRALTGGACESSLGSVSRRVSRRDIAVETARARESYDRTRLAAADSASASRLASLPHGWLQIGSAELEARIAELVAEAQRDPGLAGMEIVELDGEESAGSDVDDDVGRASASGARPGEE
ncbi:unnamed protein product, partial [Symbiodinium sp. KB8]